MPVFELSRSADNDLDLIADYSLAKWGERSTRKYISGLMQSLKLLADNPGMGHSAAEYAPLLKRYNFKAHTIFYEAIDNGVFIVRILGGNQDFPRYL